MCSTTSDLFFSINVRCCLGTESGEHGTCLTVGVTGQHSPDGSFCGKSGGTNWIFLSSPCKFNGFKWQSMLQVGSVCIVRGVHMVISQVPHLQIW